MNDELNRNAVSEVTHDEAKEEYVPKKAFSEVSSDMHRYKSKLKETEAAFNQLKAEKEEAERQSLVANQEYKVLWEQTQTKLSDIEKARKQEKEQFINHHKKLAVTQEIGGFRKDDYTNFIDVSKIEVDENGNIVKESLASEVSRIKQHYPELIKSPVAQSLPSGAPKSFTANTNYRDMSQSERDALKEKLLRDKK